MSRTPSLCGGFLTDKRSMVAFTWSVTTVLTIFAFATALVLTVKVHTHYKYLERYYDGDDWYDSYYNYDNSEDGGNNNDNDYEGGDSQDEKYRDEIRESYVSLSRMSARSVTFVAFYTVVLATALSMYGTVAIVGFTSLRGVYIAPCFTIGSNKLRVGIFGGAIVVFANLLLVCAVVLGEVQVAGRNNDAEKEGDDNGDGDRSEPYEVERIATILAVTFMFLSALYTIFAVLLFLCHAGEEQRIIEHQQQHQHQQGVGCGVVGGGGDFIGRRTGGNATPLVGLGVGVDSSGVVDRSYDSALSVAVGQQLLGDGGGPRGFITMDNSSQGTSE